MVVLCETGRRRYGWRSRLGRARREEFLAFSGTLVTNARRTKEKHGGPQYPHTKASPARADEIWRGPKLHQKYRILRNNVLPTSQSAMLCLRSSPMKHSKQAFIGRLPLELPQTDQAVH